MGRAVRARPARRDDPRRVSRDCRPRTAS
jgi:hypothetical protein